MTKHCDTCNTAKSNEEMAMVTIPMAAYEAEQQRHVAQTKFLIKIIFTLFIISVISILAIFGVSTYERLQYDYASYEASTDQGGDASVEAKLYKNGGDVYDGESKVEDKNQEKEQG